jgi:hypothetical protein
MKAPVVFILVSLLLRCLGARAQNNPNCNHLEVISLSASAPAQKMYVGVTNRCDDCSSGFNGCVYWEMRAIRMVAPFDTIAASQCYCLQTPNNKASLNYTLNVLSKVPPLDSLRISFTCGQDGCDTLAYGMVVKLNSMFPQKQGAIYPNPASDYVTLSELDRRIQKIIITNAAGLTIRTLTVEREKTIIDAYGLRPGFYFITGYDKKGYCFPSLKFVKE